MLRQPGLSPPHPPLECLACVWGGWGEGGQRPGAAGQQRPNAHGLVHLLHMLYASAPQCCLLPHAAWCGPPMPTRCHPPAHPHPNPHLDRLQVQEHNTDPTTGMPLTEVRCRQQRNACAAAVCDLCVRWAYSLVLRHALPHPGSSPGLHAPHDTTLRRTRTSRCHTQCHFQMPGPSRPLPPHHSMLHAQAHGPGVLHTSTHTPASLAVPLPPCLWVLRSSGALALPPAHLTSASAYASAIGSCRRICAPICWRGT